MTEDKKTTTVETAEAKSTSDAKTVNTESTSQATDASTDNKRSRAPRNNNFGNRDSRNHSRDNNHGDHKGGRRNDHRKGGRGRRPKDDFEEKVVTINRVTKVTKGGRHFRFAAVVVVGNHKGQVGFGTGKANEVPDAIKKGVKEARKNIFTVPLRGTTVPHEILGEYGAGQVLIKPAKQGTGVIAGGPARAVIELAGISDIYAKSLGSNTPINMIRATIDGLARMETLNSVNKLRFNKEPIKKTNTTNKELNKDESVKPAAKSAEVK